MQAKTFDPIEVVQLHEQFRRCADRVDALIGRGHRDHINEIIAAMSKFSEDDIALRYFLDVAYRHADMRVLSGAQSFKLFKGEYYFIRMNLWFPNNPMLSNASTLFREYLSVDVCHNHTFDFFTMGLFGPGYTSSFLETGERLADRVEGDVIECSRQWQMTLTKGEAVFVQRYKQFHSQHFPPSLSISLNVIPFKTAERTEEGDRLAKQYIIDPSTRKITRVLLPNADL